MELKDKVVLVTGASSGIGRAVALLMASKGAKVVISYKENKNGADQVLKKIEEFGVEAMALKADLKRDLEAKELVEAVRGRFGRIDILVNNAGRYVSGDEWDGEASIWMESLKQNLLSVLSVSKYVLKLMEKQKSGVVVNIASRYSVSGQFDAPAYSAAKAAVMNMTQGQAKFMAPWGRSNAVSPGAVKAGYWLRATEEELVENLKVTPLEKLIEPEDIAEAVFFLASDKAKMITGQNLIVDGGYTLK